jgi:hypothetical protein
MGKSPKENLDRITTTITAWETHRASKSFGGMTLEQFKTAIAPSLTARTTVAQHESELKAAISQRDDADDASAVTIKDVVNAVIADKEEGVDGAFYEALGYVRESERKSGLHRTAKTAESKPSA